MEKQKQRDHIASALEGFFSYILLLVFVLFKYAAAEESGGEEKCQDIFLQWHGWPLAAAASRV